jgi:hypothetical protein
MVSLTSADAISMPLLYHYNSGISGANAGNAYLTAWAKAQRLAAGYFLSASSEAMFD